MSLHILGIGTAVPDYEIAQSDAAEQVSQICCDTSDQKRIIKALYRRAGVQKRHSVVLESAANGEHAQQGFYTRSQMPDGPTTADRMLAYETHAAPLAIRAARRALDEADLDPQKITNLITVSCSGFSAPGVDVSLIQGLGLRPSTSRTHIGFMGCHAALNGLRVAKAFADADEKACVMVCAVELCSLHHQYGWQPDQIVANALFADGAAATVVRRTGDRSAPWRMITERSTVIPDSRDQMSWRIRDHGFQMSLSSQLPLLIEHSLRPWLEAWLREYELSVEQIQSWAIHPGGPRILDACVQALQLDPQCLSDSRQVLAEFGNMSSPTLLFIVDRMRQRDAARPCVALAFGPGITVEAALLG